MSRNQPARVVNPPAAARWRQSGSLRPCSIRSGSQGNFELNAMRPIIINNFLRSARILGDACEKLRCFSVEGTRLNRKRVDETVDRSLMLVTAVAR